MLYSVCGYRMAYFIAMLPAAAETSSDATGSVMAKSPETDTSDTTAPFTDRTTVPETTAGLDAQTVHNGMQIIWYVAAGLMFCAVTGSLVLYAVRKKKNNG